MDDKKQIRVDDEVKAYLDESKLIEDETYNSVLRRLLLEGGKNGSTK